MGTCQLKNCRCVCQSDRLACQCGSQNTILLEEQAREIRRRISSDQMKRSNRFSNGKSKTGSPAQSNSSDSQNKTKFSTNRKASNRSPNSTERYLMSEECNIPTESSQQKKIRKPKIRNLKFNRSLTYFSKEVIVLKFQDVIDQPQSQKEVKVESPQFQTLKNTLENKQTLDQIQSFKDPTITMKTPTTTGAELSNNATQSAPFFIQQPSISRESSPSKQSHPITQVSMEPNINKQSLSVITEQQQLKNRSHTADLSDDQKSVTPRSVLKLQQKNNDSFRTQQQEKRKVRFDLPNSHYIKERIKQQQRFFN
ncbi:unnamed protein product (macronuclear) [Paramecium tetraurelia]|uniref:Uncharacterized protein n=1 Tax=Paramecium tetraurelia TaxID=5888 RepID=A0BJQ3_PARTE|nr:uncharacterized protein GSPATT00029399001 [Paramecium tetraurelia]CAK58770.1 unnamed protein product [Paramecium tetraurelia]|eukprot:XP_001426168.1 hypothetical protein (macronuclear) [Paramecium tetraurelia strain d4-2]